MPIRVHLWLKKLSLLSHKAAEVKEFERQTTTLSLLLSHTLPGGLCDLRVRKGVVHSKIVGSSPMLPMLVPYPVPILPSHAPSPNLPLKME